MERGGELVVLRITLEQHGSAMRRRLMDGSKAEAPAYRVQPLPDARGGDSGWMIGGLWGFVLLITSLICGYAVVWISSFESSGWPLNFYTAWRITPARIIAASMMYALAGAIQLVMLRRWLPLSRWWITAVVGGHLAAVAIYYQIDRALPAPPISRISQDIIMREDLPRGLGWLLVAVLQALLLRRFSRRSWEWLIPLLPAMALLWLGSDGHLDWGWLEVLGGIAYLLLGAVALVRLLRSAPYPDRPA
jgi:hypothetical protein